MLIWVDIFGYLIKMRGGRSNKAEGQLAMSLWCATAEDETWGPSASASALFDLTVFLGRLEWMSGWVFLEDSFLLQEAVYDVRVQL